MSSIAERLVDRTAAAAERKSGLAGQIVFIAVGIDKFDRSLGSFDAIRTILADSNFD
jgi:hypothetical protein